VRVIGGRDSGRAQATDRGAAAVVLAPVAADDGIVLTAAEGAGSGAVALSWSGGPAGPYSVYRSTYGSPNAAPSSVLGSTSAASWSDTPPAIPGVAFFYKVTVAPFWNRDTLTAPVDPQSGTIIANLNAAGGFGDGRLQIDFSINVLDADASVPFLSFH